MVEKHERPDHTPFRERQNAPDFETAKVLAPLFNHQFQHRITHSAQRPRS
jgi:hypothetical protein